MQGMGDGSCPFDFNTDPATFKVGDSVSYRVTGSLEGFPFAGVLLEVHEDYVVLTSDVSDAASRMRATRGEGPAGYPGGECALRVTPSRKHMIADD